MGKKKNKKQQNSEESQQAQQTGQQPAQDAESGRAQQTQPNPQPHPQQPQGSGQQRQVVGTQQGQQQSRPHSQASGQQRQVVGTQQGQQQSRPHPQASGQQRQVFGPQQDQQQCRPHSQASGQQRQGGTAQQESEWTKPRSQHSQPAGQQRQGGYEEQRQQQPRQQQAQTGGQQVSRPQQPPAGAQPKRGPQQQQQPQQQRQGGGNKENQPGKRQPQSQQARQDGSQQQKSQGWEKPRGDGRGAPQPQDTGGHGDHAGNQRQGAIPKQHGAAQQQRIVAASRERASPGSSSTSSAISISNIRRGEAGISGEVEANYLAMNLDKMPSIAYHYDVTIEPDRPKKFLRPAFVEFLRQYHPNVPMAYDGQKNAYSTRKLESNITQATVTVADSNGKGREMKVSIQPTENCELNLNDLRTYFQERIYDKPMRVLQCLEVVLASPCHNKGVRVGRSFFVQPAQKMDLRDGYELWTGIYQAAILGDQPFLNVDISHKSFPSENKILNIVRMYGNFNENSTLDSRSYNNLRNFLSTLRISYEPPKVMGVSKKTYSFVKLTDVGARGYKFIKKDGDKEVELTIEQHYMNNGVRLQYPNLNCLSLGNKDHPISVPMEFCSIEAGQATNKKDGQQQVQQMIRYAATSTDERKAKIMNLLKMFHWSQPNQIVQSFGVVLGTNFIKIPMRLLDSPCIEYANGLTCRVQNGSWRLEDRMNFLVTRNTEHKWAVIWADRGNMSVSMANNLVDQLLNAARNLKLQLASKPELKQYRRVEDTLREYKQKGFHLVVVVLPRFGTTYAEVKQTAELKYGVLTQCIKEETVQRRLNYQLALNLLLKVNAKLNGTNHKIKEKLTPSLGNVMFLGADVTHPSPDQRFIPSVVGVAASHDKFGACYNMQYRLQTSALETIQDMSEITKKHLQFYFQCQGHYPDNIIYYRDGVSDGQFKIIRDEEIRGIRAACKSLGQQTKITCIIVVKRHHTRLFPVTRTRDKFNNVSPGTVVDRVIVHPNEVQFFMVSHQSIQGTAKPTRYNVIVDDANINIDELQRMTNNLCHLFPRCNRAVSYPAPAYLAHLVAYRGRVYIEGGRNFRNLKQEYENRLVEKGFMLSNPMYFV